MKKITLLLAFSIGFSGAITSQEQKLQTNKFDYPTAYYSSETIAHGETNSQKINYSNTFFDLGVPIPNTGKIYQQRPGGINALIYDNGPHFNLPGSPNFSRMEDVTLLMDSYGFNVTYNAYHVADEFTLTDQTQITSIDMYGYQTGGPSNSINGVYVQVWDGDPSSGTATVVWGDRTTNIFGGVVSSTAYRDLESTPGDTSREIQLVTANTPNLILNPGTYWIEYGFAGTGTSGPWAPPISILGTASTGNSLQYDVALNTWAPIIDSGSNTGQGLPFQIYGNPAAFPGSYCGPLVFPTNVEPITRVKLGGIDNLSSETLNGSPEHEDFTAVSTLLEEGQSYPIILEGNTNGNNTNRFVVFVDWNQNGVLDDAGEVYEMTVLLNNSTGVDGKQVTGTISIPMGAKIGTTRMRVKKISGTTNFLNPCLGANLGQAEDYTLEVVAAGYFPPSNDDCSDAIAIGCGDSLMGSTKNATTNYATPVCGNVSATSPGVWYVLDDNSNMPGDITVSLCGSNTDFDTKLSVFSGDCTNLVCVDGNDDACGDQSEVTFASDGNTVYYIHVHGYDGQTGNFELQITCDPIIGTPENAIEGFSFYPNPSNDIVKLQSMSNIESVILYNMLGQPIIENQINAPSFEMNVSGLSVGTYLMKVVIDGQTATYRMIKK